MRMSTCHGTFLFEQKARLLGSDRCTARFGTSWKTPHSKRLVECVLHALELFDVALGEAGALLLAGRFVGQFGAAGKLGVGADEP